MSNAFQALGINHELSDLLQKNGITDPTPVQKQTIPMLLAGQDVIAQAQTGTGKTMAFALPILQRINTEKEQVQALILTPTRELAIQITSELKKLAPIVGASVLAAYGGQDVEAQIHKLKRSPHIVVATPGRLIDHMKRETINLGKLSMLVLDEADQMLHMGFLPEVESIVTQTPRARQTMLFSATMPDAIRRLAAEYMKSPSDVRIRSANVTLDNIKQLVIETTDRAKQGALVHLLQLHQPYLAVIFCRTKVRAKKLNEALQDLDIESDELHGDLTQAKREQVMKRFRDARLQVLVATDVAARGLDVDGVTHVYNYDVPQDGELYIHRIGRTGRAGHSGMAITLATPYDKNNLLLIEQSINAKLERRKIDSEGILSMSNEPATERGAGRGRTGKSGNAGGGDRARDAKGTGRGRQRSEGPSSYKSAGRSGGREQKSGTEGRRGGGRTERSASAGAEKSGWGVERVAGRGAERFATRDEAASRGTERGRAGRAGGDGTSAGKRGGRGGSVERTRDGAQVAGREMDAVNNPWTALRGEPKPSGRGSANRSRGAARGNASNGSSGRTGQPRGGSPRGGKPSGGGSSASKPRGRGR
ncbi:DEAD/DEAH box helicase [Paenibacillus harenae]|uniref:DEAD/DEAH box helicase n=1 Tax=Paenibacillus harenae TaxID=306543 RepID=UPI0027926000|nr:DEAD/DEAH box helicase [Paenibacillus harenae]MDQ0058415.1 ATP-dependent RNA helicase DeaD [Paenibacillus harenae]